jgi:hypothetical protein
MEEAHRHKDRSSMPKAVVKKPTFGLTIDISKLQLNVEIESDTLETAVAEGRALKVGELLGLPDNVTVNDHEGTILVGVYKY